jgi:NAD(P)-dependent dehydrogenase (short-subunit alcohol dehydrogenase family)
LLERTTHPERKGRIRPAAVQEDTMLWSNAALIVTGGTRGLGYALVRELGARGARLALVAMNLPRLERVAARLRSEGVAAVAIAADVGEKEAIHKIVGQAQALIGPIDGVIHNASTLGPTPLRPLLETECEDFARVFEVNVLGPFRLNKALLPSLLVRGRGVITHVSSDAALEAYPSWGPYGASKAALDHMSRTFAAELADSPLRFLSIDPGEMDTDMHRAALPDADPTTLLDPRVVAARIVRIMEQPARYPSGARVRASEIDESEGSRR